MNGIVLDPRISYSALKDEFENDIDLSSHLEISKDDLHKHYQNHYAPPPPSPSQLSSQLSLQPSISATSKASPQKNFISRFNRKPHTSTDELLEFWSLSQEDIEKCDPLHWWYGRRTQFPNLYHLVRDIFSIPGVYFIILCSIYTKLWTERVCCCCGTHFFWWEGHNISMSSKFEARDNPCSHACQEETTFGTREK